MFRNVFGGCVSDRSSQTEVLRSQKLKFGASLSSALKHGYLPGPLVDILVHISQEGIATPDVFRRPGNPKDTRRIVQRLTEGKQVIYANYSFYTLASVVKQFLLKIPGGIFTPEGEEQLLKVLTIEEKMGQIDAVHNFIVSLAPAHQHLVALLFGTWFRIVSYQEENHMNMSVEALSRSVAGSMFHTCAEDPAKVEKASRIMQFLIDNFGVERMFGQENIRFFAETAHTGIHIRELYRYSYCRDSHLIPTVRPDIIEVTRLDREEEEEDDGLGREREFSESPQPSPSMVRCSDLSGDVDDQDVSQLMINMSTISAPEVSLVPSPDVSKRPKSLEDNLNEVRTHYQSRCLSRFNSVKRKQLERLRQRSDWFLSPTVRERNNSRKGRSEGGSLSLFAGRVGGASACTGHAGCAGINNPANNSSNINTSGCSGASHTMGSTGNNKSLQQKNSGNSVVTKASSEGAVLDVFSDGDSVFTDNTSRSESPASEPVWTHAMKVHSRDIIHSDTIAELEPEMGFYTDNLSVDNLSAHYSIDLSPSPSGRSRVTTDDGEEGLARQSLAEEPEEEEDEENTTPTGLQDEDDGSTLILSSIVSIDQQQQNSSSTGEEDTEKESLDEPVNSPSSSPTVEISDPSSSPTVESSGASLLLPPHPPQTSTFDGQQILSHNLSLTPDTDVRHSVDIMVDKDSEQEIAREELSSPPASECFLVERTYGTDKPQDS